MPRPCPGSAALRLSLLCLSIGCAQGAPGPHPSGDEAGPKGDCLDSCMYAGDGECDDGRPGAFSGDCVPGTDCTDCETSPGEDGGGGDAGAGEDGITSTPECNDDCEVSGDGLCDDGRGTAFSSVCPPGTDCTDCGPPDAPLPGLMEVPCTPSETPVQIVHNAPRETALEVLFVAAGFEGPGMSTFCTSVGRMVEGLGRQHDFGAYWNRINVHRLSTTQFSASFEDAFGSDSALFGLPPHLAHLKTEFDTVVIVVRTPEGQSGRAYAGEDGAVVDQDDDGFVVAHELGHSLVQLADEYGEKVCGFEEVVGPFRKVNVVSSTNPADYPWRDLLTPGVPIPTDASMYEAVGGFPVVCDDGRPSESHVAGAQCLMGDSFSPMCAACRRELDRFMAAFDGTNADMHPTAWGRECEPSWYGDGLCDQCDPSRDTWDGDPECAVDAGDGRAAEPPLPRKAGPGCRHGGLPLRLRFERPWLPSGVGLSTRVRY